MPKNPLLKKVLVIGSGPIVIGQGAEFDYSGTQAVQSLIEEGLEVVLVNSNPATIMTDRETAHKVYIEPLTEQYIKKIIEREKPDGLLPTLGGQTALNLAVRLAEEGFLKKNRIALLGCEVETIKQAEDRKLFKELMIQIGEPVPDSTIIHSLEEALKFADKIGYPVIVRPAFTLGGTGGGIAANEEELIKFAQSGLSASPINQCLVEKSIAGLKEIEFEVMRDQLDRCIIVCHMENFDPVGIHTGDSIVFAPCLTLNDRELQMLRSSALKIIRSLKIAGGCNVQYALDSRTQEYYVIEVNPRVSRSSALASKATGYPIAKMAAKIAIGLNLDEIKNPITKNTYACFEPALDYIVTKIPRWPFDKFETANRHLGTQMKATGEVMSLARNLEESLLKSVRSLELKVDHIELDELKTLSPIDLKNRLIKADDRRLFVIGESLRRGFSIEEIFKLTHIDLFFLKKIHHIISIENELKKNPLTQDLLRKAKKYGLADSAIARFTNRSEDEVREKRHELNIRPVFKMIDTCAGEFASATPYLYSTYDETHDLPPSKNEKVIVLGSGPIRIGQGIEFDYSTVHAVKTLKEKKIEAIVINNNPETVSTDFNLSDRLYFEPLTLENVLEIIHYENPKGVIVQFGGQTAINLAYPLAQNGVNILGTSVDSIDQAEDRKKFEVLLKDLHITQPPGTTVLSATEAMEKCDQIGFPLILRPSYVLGGRAMEILFDKSELFAYMTKAIKVNPDHPVLMDRYLTGIELEVDAISDGVDFLIPGIMEHIEKAGVHSGDSIAVYPPQHINQEMKDKIIQITKSLCQALKVKGFINIQFVIHENKIYVIEVNPRASRTVPFLSKVTHIPMAKYATLISLGESLKSFSPNLGLAPLQKEISIKAPVFSFAKLIDVEIALGPEMKSTGEVMGHDKTFEGALKKALRATGMNLPSAGQILVTLADKDKQIALPLLKRLHALHFEFMCTSGTASFLKSEGITAKSIDRIGESEKDILYYIKNNYFELIINTISKSKTAETDGHKMRRSAVERGVPILTSLDTVDAIVQILEFEQLHFGLNPI